MTGDTVTITSGSFVNSRKQTLATLQWTPPGEPSGLVLFHIGYGEYVDRYRDALSAVSKEANVIICSFDTHGHGRSEPKGEKERCYVNEWEDVTDDATQHMELVLPKFKGLPCIVAGHSMGGLVAVFVLLKRQKDFAGLVLQSAAIDVEWTPLLRFQSMIGDCLAGCVPHAKLVPAVRPEDMNPDPKLVEEYKNDPLIYQGNVQARTANEILKGFKACAKVESQISVPIFAIHGDHDKTTSLKAVKRLLERSASNDKTLEVMKGGYHEISFGPLKDQARELLVVWLQKHLQVVQLQVENT